jgi:uridine kinase
MNYVIAIAAPIGAGKTTLTNALATVLGNAPTIYFDNYECATEKSVTELQAWLHNGADFNEFIAPNLAKDLSALKGGNTYFDPLTLTEIKQRKFIVFEAPMGKEYFETAHLIDLLVWIELPLDVALARKINQLTRECLANKANETQGFLAWLDDYLKNYLLVVRQVLLLQKQKVSVNADIIVDGEATLDTMVQQILAKIEKLYGY